MIRAISEAKYVLHLQNDTKQILMGEDQNSLVYNLLRNFIFQHRDVYL